MAASHSTIACRQILGNAASRTNKIVTKSDVRMYFLTWESIKISSSKSIETSSLVWHSYWVARPQNQASMLADQFCGKMYYEGLILRKDCTEVYVL